MVQTSAEVDAIRKEEDRKTELCGRKETMMKLQAKRGRKSVNK
jgi:hypothetical protein